MIPASNIIAIMKALSTFLGIDFARSDQTGDVLPVPYFSYKMTTANQESSHQDVQEVQENAIDITSADVIRYEKVEETFSLNFYDKNRVDREITLAEQALRWFKSISGKETCRTNEIIPRMVDTVVQDRMISDRARKMSRRNVLSVRFMSALHSCQYDN